jgi:hypothetical protein
VNGNGAISVAHQLIAAKLNAAADASPALAPLSSADATLLNLAPGLLPPFGKASARPALVSDLVSRLDAYNLGIVGPPACSSE